MFIAANWPLKQNKIGAVHTIRQNGYSQRPYQSLNLGYHVKDLAEQVAQNHFKVKQALGLQLPLQIVQQVHGQTVMALTQPLHITELPFADAYYQLPKADALYTRVKGLPLCMLTADCLPIFLANQITEEIAIIHGGWRSLSQGIIANTLKLFSGNRQDIMAYMGAAISLRQFEVGDDVKQAFIAMDAQLEAAFMPSKMAHKSFADLYAIGKILLQNEGVQSSYQRKYCTYTDEELFFSYRREKITGRMANIIWLR